MKADINSIIQTCIFAGQLLATVFTYIFLYRTLKAQKVANDLTNKKFLYDIKPIFKKVEKVIDRGDINPIQFTNYTVNLTNNTAFDISIIKERFDSQIGFIERSKMKILAVDDELLIIDGRFSPQEFLQEVIIKIRFYDEVRTYYEQKIYGVLAYLHITPPYLATNAL